MNQLAAKIAAIAAGEDSDYEPGAPELTAEERSKAAAALGRLGGLKGGKARAAKLSPEQRQEAARTAALARWKRSD